MRERRGSARDCVGGAPAQAPGSVHPVAARSRSLTAPAALAAASGSLRAGHRLPFPSGGGGGRSLSSRRPLSRPGGPAPPRRCTTQLTWCCSVPEPCAWAHCVLPPPLTLGISSLGGPRLSSFSPATRVLNSSM